jgi:hypothetical protein
MLPSTAMNPLSHAAMRRLVGTWRGRGRGVYPGVQPFSYVEETSFVAAEDWAMVHVVQKTWRDSGDGVRGAGLHLETGLVIARDDGSLVYSCAQDSGRTEVMVATPEATQDGQLHLRWETTAHGNDPRLVKMGRDFWVSDAAFVYKAYLSTVRTPEYRQHLECRLERVDT